jgi:bla regulator protein BlaR1
MLVLFVDQILPERLIKTLCWTLVHSIWQGLALTILTGILILLTRRSGARIRYALFSAAFLLFLAAACCTFAWQWNKLGAVTITVSGGAQHVDEAALPRQVALPATGSAMPVVERVMETMSDYFNEHASLIITIWFIIFSARLARILGGLGRMQRIRHYRTHVPSSYWAERVNALAALLQIRTPVSLLESELIKAPMMAGVFKPVILLPFSLLAQLPAGEMEAILLHELAHIRRKDYLINLLQSFAEILFFFNPGVWWISSLIREERENCCDDIAVGVGGNKKEFIHALVSFQEYGGVANKFGIALRGTGNHLLQRVKRILVQDEKILDGREKLFLGCSIVIMLAMALTFTGIPAAQGAGHFVATHGANGAFDARIRIASDSDTVVAVRPATSLRIKARARIAEPVKDTAVRPKVATDPALPKQPTAESREISEEMMEKLQLDLEGRQRDMELKSREMELKQLEWKKKTEDLSLRAEEWKRAAAGETRELTAKQREEMDRQRKMMVEQQELDLYAQEQKMAEQERTLSKLAMEADQQREWKMLQVGGNQKVIESILRDLLDENLVGDTEQFSFELNGKELKVDGKRQPDEVYKRFLEKYIKNPKTEFKYFRKKNGSESITINVN